MLSLLLGALLIGANFNFLPAFGIESEVAQALVKGAPVALAAGIVLLRLHDRRFLQRIIGTNAVFAPLYAMYLFGVASALWSALPLYSIGRAVFSAIFVFTCSIQAVLLYESAKDWRHLWKIFIGMLALPVLVMVVLALLDVEPVYRFTEYAYGRRLGGIVIHPNAIGLLCTATLLAMAIDAFLLRARFSFWKTVVIAAAMYGLIASQSRSAMLNLVVSLGYIGLVSPMRLSSKITLLLVPFVLALGYVLFGSGGGMDVVTGYLLRDSSIDDIATLSNRTLLWEQIESDLFSMLFGNGFMTLTSAGNVAIEGLDTAHAHNGFLQVYAGLGVIGLALLGWWAVRIYSVVRRMEVLARRPFVAFSLFFLISNLGMSGVGFQMFPHVAAFLTLLAVARRHVQPQPVTRAAFAPAMTPT